MESTRKNFKYLWLDLGVPATYLFLDLDGCDSLKRRLGEKSAQRHLSGHYEAIRAAIESYNGTHVKQTATGIGATFHSASRAVGCALHIQRVIAKRNAVNLNDAVKVRIGLDAGEAIVEDNNDSFGVLTERARQISAWAEAGQVLASDVVRQLVSVKGFKFEPAGVKRLKGFDDAVALYKLSPG